MRDSTKEVLNALIDKGYEVLQGKGFIGIKGERLNTFACYKEYRIVDSL